MPNTAYIQIRVYLPIATGTFWFDDFTLDDGIAARYPYHPGYPVVASGSIFYSSPVSADINEDGKKELLIAGGGDVNGWDQNGKVLPGFPIRTGDKHIQSQLAVEDLDGNGDLEIVAGTRTAVADGQAQVFAWHHTGALFSGWPKRVDWNSQYGNNDSIVSTVVIADINRDKQPDILAGTTNNTASYRGSTPPPSPNLYAWNSNGSIVSGLWPTWHNTAGIYGLIAVGDLDGDGTAEVEVGRDHHYLNAYRSDGSLVPGWPIETYLNANAGRYDVDEHIGYSMAAPIIADLEGDGKMEYIAAGFVEGPGNAVVKNSAVLVLQSNGSRKPGWEQPALGSGIINPYELAIQAPAVADLDGDGRLEIVVSTNDGWIRAYKANKQLLWAFNYTQGAVLLGSEPVIGDIDADGALEIVFGTRVPSQQGGTYYSGPVGIWALEANGSVVSGFPLPLPTPGMFGAPTLDDFDGDGLLEIIAASREGEVTIWDTPAKFNPNLMPWPTGRHDNQRTAAYKVTNPLAASSIRIMQVGSSPQKTATVSIHIHRTGQAAGVPYSMQATIPSGLSIVPGTLKFTSGSAAAGTDQVQWTGDLANTNEAVITFDIQATGSEAQIYQITAAIDTVTNGLIYRSANFCANCTHQLLPSIQR